MVFSSKGEPFIVLFGTNKVASIDPKTMAVKEYPLPNAESRPRRIAITNDDVIWYSDYRSEEHTSELQSPDHLRCRLLLEKKNRKQAPARSRSTCSYWRCVATCHCS